MATTGPVTRDTSTIALGLAQIRVGSSASYITNATSVLTESFSMGALADTKFSSNTEYWKLESGFPATEDMSIPLKDNASLECSFKEITPKNMALARGLDPFLTGTAFNVTEIVALLPATNGGLAQASSDTYITATNGATNAIVDTYTVKFTSATAYTISSASGSVIPETGAIDADSLFTVDGADGFTIKANCFYEHPNRAGNIVANNKFRFSILKDGFGLNHSGTITLGGMKSPAFVRMEAVYTYPNGVNHMYIIFPRANVTSSMEIAFQAKDNAAPSITFESKNASSSVSGGSVVWNEASLGIVYFD